MNTNLICYFRHQMFDLCQILIASGELNPCSYTHKLGGTVSCKMGDIYRFRKLYSNLHKIKTIR